MNLCLGWVWITAGLISGAAVGLFFYDPNWLGGYGTWRRRLVRLGHISFLGTGLLNLAFAFTFPIQTGNPPPVLASWLLAVGAATMPAVCFLAAWRDGLRHLFPLPVASLIGAGLSIIFQGLL